MGMEGILYDIFDYGALSTLILYCWLFVKTAELEHTRSKLTKSTREQISQQAEIRTLTV